MEDKSLTLTQKPTLLTLPVEIRQVIYSILIPHIEHEVSFIPTTNSEDTSSVDSIPAMFINCKALVQASGTLQAEVLDYVLRHCGFIHARCSEVHKLLDAIGTGGCLMVQKLELRMEGSMLHFPKRNWPRFLKLFAEDMPHMSTFKLYSQWSIEDDEMRMSLKFGEDTTVSRRGYGRSRMLRFLSYMVLRHPNLDLLVWPAKCQARRQHECGMITEWFVAERKLSDGRKWEIAVQPMAWSLPQDWGIDCDEPGETVCVGYVEDEILDSRAVRRLLEAEIAQVRLGDFVVKPAEGTTKDDILSSETIENAPSSFSVIDRDGYRDKYSRDLDDYIRGCRKTSRDGWSQPRRW